MLLVCFDPGATFSALFSLTLFTFENVHYLKCFHCCLPLQNLGYLFYNMKFQNLLWGKSSLYLICSSHIWPLFGWSKIIATTQYWQPFPNWKNTTRAKRINITRKVVQLFAHYISHKQIGYLACPGGRWACLGQKWLFLEFSKWLNSHS